MQSKSKSTLVILLVLIIGFILGSLTSGALQYRRAEKFRHMSPEGRFKEAIENIVEPTEEQKEQLQNIFDAHAQRMAEIQEEKSSEIMTVVDSLRLALSSVLTDEQKQKFREHTERARSKFFGRHLGRIKRVINLTSEQEQKIKGILESYQGTLLDDMMAGHMGPKPEMMELLKKLDKDIEEVLTPEQKTKYRSHKMKRGRRPGKRFFQDGRREGRPYQKGREE